MGAMQSKPKVLFQCQACGAQSPKWVGQCPGCALWNTLVETPVAGRGERAARAAGYVAEPPRGIVSAGDVALAAQARLPTGIGEFDRVLGGGLVPGSVVLIGGDPGIGKSTLLLQAVCSIGRSGEVSTL